MPKYETSRGIVTRGECFAKIIDLTDQLRDQALVMSHLHKTEDSAKDRLLGMQWFYVAEMLLKLREKLINIAQGNLQ